MKFENWTSDAFKVSSGFPQGLPLSSVLFKELIRYPYLLRKWLTSRCDWKTSICIHKIGAMDDYTWTINSAWQGMLDDGFVASYWPQSNSTNVCRKDGQAGVGDNISWCAVIDSRLSMIRNINNNIRKARKALSVVHYAACQNLILKTA